MRRNGHRPEIKSRVNALAGIVDAVADRLTEHKMTGRMAAMWTTLIGNGMAASPNKTDSLGLAKLSWGIGVDAVYNRISEIIGPQREDDELIVDVGCGAGKLWHVLNGRFSHYLGVDAVRYDDFPAEASIKLADLDREPLPLPAEIADVIVSAETIEHLENPRRFIRELKRVCKAKGLIIVTTPNQLSLLSKMTLIFKNEFNAFQERPGLYPAHRTALLEIDLIRIAKECSLSDITIQYSYRGRLPWVPWSYPLSVARFLPRAFSDNILLIAKKPDIGPAL
jgi:SAM-dependent methyltransferase